MVLAEIENARGQTMDISWQRQWAEQLLDDNRLYTQTADGARKAPFSRLLSDLEEILLEIADGPAKLNGLRPLRPTQHPAVRWPHRRRVDDADGSQRVT